MQRPESDDRAWPSRVVCDQPVTRRGLSDYASRSSHAPTPRAGQRTNPYWRTRDRLRRRHVALDCGGALPPAAVQVRGDRRRRPSPGRAGHDQALSEVHRAQLETLKRPEFDKVVEARPVSPRLETTVDVVVNGLQPVGGSAVIAAAGRGRLQQPTGPHRRLTVNATPDIRWIRRSRTSWERLPALRARGPAFPGVAPRRPRHPAGHRRRGSCRSSAMAVGLFAVAQCRQHDARHFRHMHTLRVFAIADEYSRRKVQNVRAHSPAPRRRSLPCLIPG